jgi:excisionase family DNA binding protein
MNDPQSMNQARQRIMEQSGGALYWHELVGWRRRRADQDVRGRTSGEYRYDAVSPGVAEQLEEQAARLAAEMASQQGDGGESPAGESPDGASGSPGDVLTTREAADLLRITPSSVAYHARRGDLPARMQGGAWQLRREDVDAFAEQRREQQETEGQEQRGGRGGRDRLDIAGVLASGGALVQSGVAAAGRTAQVIAGFVTGTVASALEMAAGATGAGVARVGDAVANLFTGAIRSGGQLVQSVGTAVTQLFTGALQLAGAAGAVVLGGAIVGLFAGAIVTIGAGLANAVSDALGAVAESAQRALSGVVTVLQDLTRAGREASRQTFGMRAVGGMQPGTDLSAMLFGQAMGADVGGMFSSWQSRPEFQRARFGAFGMGYNAADPIGSMQGAAGMLRGVDPMLQYPMASALSGGHPDALMRMAAMDPGQVDKSADLAREFGKNTDLMQRIFGTLEPTLNRIGALMTGLKLEVLEKSIPVIEWATAGLFNLWDTNKETVFGWIARIPELLGKFVDWFFLMLPKAVDWLEKMYLWFTGTLWPKISGLVDGLAGLLGISMPSGGGGGGAGGGGPRGPYAGRGGGGSRPSRGGIGGPGGIDIDTEDVADFAGDHPYLTGGIAAAVLGLLGRAWRFARPAVDLGSRIVGGAGQFGNRVLGAFPQTAGLGTSSMALGAGRLGQLAGRTMPILGDLAAGFASGGVNGDQEGWRIGGTLGSMGMGFLQGGPLGMLVRGGANLAGQFGRLAYDTWQSNRQVRGAEQAGQAHGYAPTMREIAEEMGIDRKQFEEGLDTATSRRVRDEWQRRSQARDDRIDKDPVLQGLDYLRKVAEENQKRSYYEEWKRAMLDAGKELEQQRAARGEDKATLYIQPSAEFAARMEFLQAQAHFRALQVAMA